MTPSEYNQVFQKRTKAFALLVIKLSDDLPKRTASFVISKQLIRAATSVAANYRASCISRSDKERFAKLCIVIEETDEAMFWLEMLQESGLVQSAFLNAPLQEASELLKVFMAYRSSLGAHLSSIKHDT
ncbi:MAG: four helix bundle protein [Bacteroidetes bacterium]|nr:four helix bundle protein [Bacteroidota bacterium]